MMLAKRLNALQRNRLLQGLTRAIANVHVARVRKMKICTEVVKVFDIDPFQAGSGDKFRFRLEIVRNLNSHKFMGKVYRLETYRLQPTFPQTDGELPDWKNDGLIFIVDDMFDPDVLTGASIQEVIEKFETSLNSLFKVKHQPTRNKKLKP
jgi:hypothetical protein